MFFINKYQTMVNNSYNDIINDIVKSNKNKSFSQFFQNIIIYGYYENDKDYLINSIIKKIYNIKKIEFKELKYTIPGYSYSKINISIKQSMYHMIIDPTSNSYDKYIIQEIVQEYAKSNVLNIFKNIIPYKIVVINKIDNLSYYVQILLRQIIKQYFDTCKFILISNQLSKVIEPIRSLCTIVRIPKHKLSHQIQTVMHIISEEQINISFKNFCNYINKSDNNINNLIWLLNLHKYNVNYYNNIDSIIKEIVTLITYTKTNIISNKILYNIIKYIKNKFYALFITNIGTHIIFKKILHQLILTLDDVKLNYEIINITSIYEERLSHGTRHIIHFEIFILKLINLLQNFK